MKRRTLARFASRTKKRRAEGGSAKPNPPIVTDLVEFVVPGFAGFAATKIVSRIAGGQVAKRWPRFGKHAAVIAGLASFAGAWLLAHRVKSIAKYHTPIVVGSAISALQTIAGAWLPVKYSWLFTDASPKLLSAAPAAAQPVAQQIPAGDDEDEVETDANRWYTYNDARDHGRHTREAPGVPAADTGTEPLVDESDEVVGTPPNHVPHDEDDEDYQGIFGN